MGSFQCAALPSGCRVKHIGVKCRLKEKTAELDEKLKENEQAIGQIERLELKCGMHEAEAEKLKETLGEGLDIDLPSSAELQTMCDKV